MNPGSEPRFLTREAVDAIHEDQIGRFGGLHGARDENALESAIAAAWNAYHYGGGIDASRLPEDRTYSIMIKIATHEASRGDFADYLRSELRRELPPSSQNV